MNDQEGERLRLENVELRQQLQHRDDERQAYEGRFSFMGTASFVAYNPPLDTARFGVFPLFAQPYPLPPEPVEINSQAAERAFGLLEAHVGEEALAKIQQGGAYPVPSKRWKDVVYYVPRDPHERVKVMQDGSVVMESCLVSTDASLPWADVMLQRILALEIDESVVVEVGVTHERRQPTVVERTARRFRNLWR